MFRFIYDEKVLFEHQDEETVDNYVSEWLTDNHYSLYDFSNSWLNEDNYQDFETDFKAEYIIEVDHE